MGFHGLSWAVMGFHGLSAMGAGHPSMFNLVVEPSPLGVHTIAILGEHLHMPKGKRLSRSLSACPGAFA